MGFTRRLPPFIFRCQNPACGIEVVAPAKERRRGRKFCSHSCAAKAHNAGARYPLMRAASDARSEKIRGTGSYPYVKRGGRHEHRVVMEQKLGRLLLPGEIVHHADEDGHNNSPGNLHLTDRPEHARIHMTGKKRLPKTHCKRGHELTPENTKVRRNGHRRYLKCEREYQRIWHSNKRRTQRENHPVTG